LSSTPYEQSHTTCNDIRFRIAELLSLSSGLKYLTLSSSPVPDGDPSNDQNSIGSKVTDLAVYAALSLLKELKGIRIERGLNGVRTLTCTCTALNYYG
jgi:hypothetical protein